MFHERIIKKIPGDLAVRSKKEGQGYIDNLGNKQKFELLDLLERQNKLLANKFVAKLPDKGEKIVKFRDSILKEIKHRDEVDRAANLLSRLNIASEGKLAMNALEWTGKYDNKSSFFNKFVELDSDDETDPLKILAQPTGTGVHATKTVIDQTEESLIKPDDVEEIESFKSENSLGTEHIKYIVDIVENPENDKHRESFKPFKTTRSNVHDPMKEKLRKKDKHWEVTAATPPLIIHGAVKSLSLQESLNLQKEQADKLQEIQAKHAIERLTQQIGLNCIGDIARGAENYRTRDKDSDLSSSDDEEEQEVHDDEDNDKAGTVVFTVDNIVD